MRNTIKLIFSAVLLLCLVGCNSTIEEDISVICGEQYVIESDILNKYNNIDWISNNDTVVNVENACITAISPGNAVITASEDGKILAKYNVSVVLIPIENIILSTNSCEIVEGESYTLSYTFFPANASLHDMKWQSLNTEIATVDENGLVTAVSVGNTAVVLSQNNGATATCSISVKQKSAYDRLSVIEKAFVNVFMTVINNFKNPSSVNIIAVEKEPIGTYYVKVSAQNGFGGMTTSTYYIRNNYIVEDKWKSITHDSSSFDLKLINEAIDELQ